MKAAEFKLLEITKKIEDSNKDFLFKTIIKNHEKAMKSVKKNNIFSREQLILNPMRFKCRVRLLLAHPCVWYQIHPSGIIHIFFLFALVKQ
jgi:hypothetical protein